MVTRVLSIIRGADAGAARALDPSLDLTVHAVADEVDLTLLLKDQGVQLALARAACHREEVAGLEVPATEPATDVRGLLSSGVRVLAVDEDLRARGLRAADLIDGVAVVAEQAVADLIVDHDVTLTTSG